MNGRRRLLSRPAWLASFLASLLLSVVAHAETADVSIYDYLRAHVDPATGALAADGTTLPDESPARRFGRFRWVPGALEGLGTRHMQWDGSDKASRAVRLLEAIAGGDPTAEAVLYELLRTDDVVTFYSQTLDLASELIRNVEPELHGMARRLATTAHDRGPVKFAIAMLGSIGDERDLSIVQTLALHDEFGLYAAEAIAEIAPDRQGALFDMARHLTGWGRIEAVARMVSTSDPTLRTWLLTEGFRNSVTPQYLAYQCVTIANLASALAASPTAKRADIPLLVGAADLIQALTTPGPGQGFDDYSDAQQTATLFLQHIDRRRDSLSFFLAATALKDYASGATAWTPAQRGDVTALATRIANDPVWRKDVVAAISDDRADLDQAELAARKLGIPTFQLHIDRLAKNSSSPQRWSHAFASADAARVDRLIDIAERAFGTRLAEARTHRSTDPRDRSAGAALEAVLQGVAHYPGSGLALVEASLADTSGSVRRAAVDTLVRWGDPYLRSESVRTALSDAARDEADELLKARMLALLNASAIK